MRFRLLGQQIALPMVALATIEVVVFYTSLLAAGRLRFGGDLAQLERDRGPLWPRALLFSAAMAVCLLAFGLYSARQRARSGGIFVRVAIAVLAGIVITAACFYIIPDLWIGRGVLSLAALTAALIVLILRLGFSHLMDEAPFRRRVVVYGTGQRATAVSQLRRRADQRGFLLTGFVRPVGEGLNVPEARVLNPEGQLLNYCRQAAIDEIVVAMDDRRRAFPVRELLECRLAGIDVVDLLTFLERETGRVRLDVLDPSWLIFGKGFRRGSLRRLSSNVLDVVASLMLLIVSLPFMLGTMIAIKFEEGWRAPVFYRQERVGLGGRTFYLLKFRSMRLDAESNGEARWAQKQDPRATRVGAVIRKLRIDELPQILNVLRGDMCFVGPRPERPQFVAELAESIPYYMQRHCVKPGITGWAQLCYPYGSSQQDAVEKLQYDLYYIKNAGILLDLTILAQTAEVVIFGKGAR
ncbi:MAG TPA: TIGR03013 family XrtA/PEP-CTERM system glycosyltransferase [Steroidobacteraceae bacterium]|jgi:sugar transferase (PEP-CTERM system associated)|nr:TIGR03013 family XrtA/PEP-CTERM system glycosyltransferase [Steroidobacteraceae bacterium]